MFLNGIPTYRGNTVIALLILTLALDGGKSSTSCPGSFTHGKKLLCIE